MQIKPNEGAPQPRLPSIRPQAAGTLAAETGDVKQALGSALETRPEAVSVSLSGAVRALAMALSQVLPDLGPLQAAELLTQADRLMLVRARDFAQAAHIELDEVKKLVVDLYLFRALEQGSETPFVPLLQAAVAAFAPKASLDAARAEPRVPGQSILPLAGEDATGELGRTGETQAAPMADTPLPAARPGGGNLAMSSEQSALGAAPALALPTFTPRDEALARAILGGTALRDTPLDRRFVQALLDPDQQPSHAVDFAFLRRLVVALSALPDRAAPDPSVSFARRDARAQLAQAVSALALSLRELPQVSSVGFDQGAAVLLARLPSLVAERPLQAGFAPNASSAAQPPAPALATGARDTSPQAQAPTALPERVRASNTAGMPQAAAPQPAPAQPSAPGPNAQPPAASLPAQVTAQPSAARAAAIAARPVLQTPNIAAPRPEAALQGGTALPAAPTPAASGPGAATRLTTSAATLTPQQDNSTGSTQAAAWGEAPARTAAPAQVAAHAPPAPGRNVAAVPASAPSATPVLPAPPLGTTLGPAAPTPTAWEGRPQVPFAAQGALEAAPLGTPPTAYGTRALPQTVSAPLTTPHGTGALQRPPAGAETALTPQLANTAATLRDAYASAPPAREAVVAPSASLRTGSPPAHAALPPRGPAAPTRDPAPLTRNDRALLSLLYAATEQRGEGPQAVDDVARALISLRRAERAEATPRHAAASPSEAPPTTRAAAAAPTRAALAQPAPDQPARRAQELAEPTPPPTNDVRSPAPEAERSWLRASFEPSMPTGAREHAATPKASGTPRETPHTSAPTSTTTTEGSLPGSARSFGSSTQLAARVAGSYGSFAPPSMAQASSAAAYGATPTFDALAGREAAPNAATPSTQQPLPQRPLDVAQALGVKGLVGALRERSLRSLRLAQRPGRDVGVRSIEGLREAAYDAEADDPLLEASARRRRRARWQLLLQRRKRRRKQER